MCIKEVGMKLTLSLIRHDLRHTFASCFIQNGGELDQRSRILGHTTMTMTTRYSNLRTDDLHASINRVAQNRSKKNEMPDYIGC